jgi:hypothetical protein
MVAGKRPIHEQAYHARAIQFLAWLPFPATTAQILAHYQRKNTPMELIEDTLALPERTFSSAEEFADAVLAVHRERPPHAWTSREMVEEP